MEGISTVTYFAEDYATKVHCKHGSLERWTPWDLLSASADDDVRAGRLFVDYAKAFFGQRQLEWSLRKKPFRRGPPSGFRGLASAERFLSPRLNLSCAQVFQVRCDCPDEPEPILHFAIAVAPELVP